MDKNTQKMGIGAIVRDSMGDVLATLLAPKDYIIKLDIAKAMEALRVVQFCGEVGFYRVVLEGDALQVV